MQNLPDGKICVTVTAIDLFQPIGHCLLRYLNQDFLVRFVQLVRLETILQFSLFLVNLTTIILHCGFKDDDLQATGLISFSIINLSCGVDLYLDRKKNSADPP